MTLYKLNYYYLRHPTSANSLSFFNAMKRSLAQPPTATSPNIAPVAEIKSHSALIIGAVAALAITVLISAGYILLRQRHIVNSPKGQQAGLATTRAQSSPRAQIAQDEPRLKDGQVLIGGTVRNISGETLYALSVKIALIKRGGGEEQSRFVDVVPRDVAPDAEGKFLLTVPSHDFTATRITGLQSSVDASQLAFTIVPGVRRPLEKPPQASQTIVVQRPAQRRNGEEFLNTPNNPETVR